jgi:hypothetical protein
VPLTEVKEAIQRADTMPVVFITPDWEWRTRVLAAEYNAAVDEAYEYLRPFVDERSRSASSTMVIGLNRSGGARIGDGDTAQFDVALLDGYATTITLEIISRLVGPAAIAIGVAAWRRRFRWLILLPILVVLFDFIPPSVSPFVLKPEVTAVAANTVSLQDFV